MIWVWHVSQFLSSDHKKRVHRDSSHLKIIGFGCFEDLRHLNVISVKLWLGSRGYSIHEMVMARPGRKLWTLALQAKRCVFYLERNALGYFNCCHWSNEKISYLWSIVSNWQNFVDFYLAALVIVLLNDIKLFIYIYVSTYWKVSLTI